MKNLKISLKKFLIFFVNKTIKISFFFYIRALILKICGCKIGDNVAIHSDVWFYDFGKLSIGNSSTVNKYCIIDNRGKVTIGENVNISHSCHIYTQSHDLTKEGAPLLNKVTRIENDSWLFPGVKLMPGVTVGKGAVVYPYSVVVKDVEEYSVVGGYPAKFIKFRDKEVSWKLDNRIHFSL